DRYLISEGLAVRSLVACGLVTPPDGRDLDSLTLEELGVPVLNRLPGSQLEGLKFLHPLVTRQSVLVLGEHVNLDAGTGVVHIAPGHGVEDFAIGQKYNLPALCPVDERGVFTEDAGRFAGMHIEPGNRAVVDALQAEGALLREEAYQHSYPTCWRCHGPVIFRATVQWFMNMDHAGHRQKCLRAIDESVRWYPPEAAGRIRSYVANRPDWCLSRQRSWGVGIPVIYCETCNNPVASDESICLIAEAIRNSDSDVWYEKDVSAFLPPGTVCSQCGGAEFRKETDTLSVWFDSGSSCRAVLEGRHGLEYPAALYMEGYDQLRAWFNESLMIGMATRGRPPYKEVVAHGFTVDEHGRKMSKSLGNVVDPMKLMETYGADILRWMAMSFDYWEDMRLGDTTLKQYAEQYRDIRNRFRFMLGNLHDFMPGVDSVSPNALEEVDQWILDRLQRLVQRVTTAYDNYQYHIVTRELSLFLSGDLSAFYLDTVKDRLYTSLPSSPGRRSAQTAIYELSRSLAIILSPIMVHTMEEVWSHLPGGRDEVCSVHLAEFPVPRTAHLNDDLAAQWEPLFEVKRETQRVLDAFRRDGSLKNTREAAITLRCGPALAAQLAHFGSELATLLMVSEVTVLPRNAQSAQLPHTDTDMKYGILPADWAGLPDEKINALEVDVARAVGTKCTRCWNVRTSVGSDPERPELCNSCAPVVRDWPIYS
ncbi:MAG: class I tRNA ligase family protein, partial [Armatimonadota bacterium]|nr:class I tRNA ligase family protein [Armatimonadota bacterium]